MKFFYSLLLLSSSIHASTPYIQVSYKPEDIKYAMRIKKVIDKRFGIPKKMYFLKQVDISCNSLDPVRAIHLCIDSNNFKVIYKNERVLNETLGVFWK